jgi:hypothetical protein
MSATACHRLIVPQGIVYFILNKNCQGEYISKKHLSASTLNFLSEHHSFPIAFVLENLELYLRKKKVIIYKYLTLDGRRMAL